MRLYCGNGFSACATLPLKPGNTAFVDEGNGTPAPCANETIVGFASASASGMLRTGKPSFSAFSGSPFKRWKLERNRVAWWPIYAIEATKLKGSSRWMSRLYCSVRPVLKFGSKNCTSEPINWLFGATGGIDG